MTTCWIVGVEIVVDVGVDVAKGVGAGGVRIMLAFAPAEMPMLKDLTSDSAPAVSSSSFSKSTTPHIIVNQPKSLQYKK